MKVWFLMVAKVLLLIHLAHPWQISTIVKGCSIEFLMSLEAENAVDFILISRLLKSNARPGVSDAHHAFSHQAYHCSTLISWVVDGPRTRHHNFSTSFCEINFRMTLYNSLNALASVNIKTLDSTSISDQSRDATSGNKVGWHDVSDIKTESDALRTNVRKSLLPERVSPFIWSG